MDTIQITEINFDNLTRLKRQGTFSLILRDDQRCYKFIRHLNKNQKKHLAHKLKYFDKLNDNCFLIPENIIMDNDELIGYTMKYFDNSIDLYNKYTKSDSIDFSEFNHDLRKSSKVLREFHKKGFVFLDMSFSNILKSEDGDIKLCDFDGTVYKENVELPITSQILNDYLVDYKNKKIKVSPNTDRLSLLLSMYVALFKKEIENIKEEEYDYLANRIRSLKLLKYYYKILLDKKREIPEIPYLDRILCDDQHININYKIDDKKILIKCDR